MKGFMKGLKGAPIPKVLIFMIYEGMKGLRVNISI